MITEKDTIKREAIFNDDKTHRFLWRQVWDSKKPLACVIMINPCLADTKMLDTTTFLTLNNICRLGDYGGVTIVNLFSLLTPKLHFNSTAKLNDEANDSYIKKAAEEASVVILAWGKSVDTNIRLYNRSREVIDLLSDQKEKFRIISDGERIAMHPLTPSVRNIWFIVSAAEWLEARKKTEDKSALAPNKVKISQKSKAIDF